MFCSKCGEKLDDGIKFCSKCGEEINSAGTVIQSIPANPVTLPVPKETKKKQGFANTSLVFGILAVVYGFLPYAYSISRKLGEDIDASSLIPAISAVVLFVSLSATFGLISFIKTKNGKALAGVILSGFALLLIIISVILWR
ncbi:MAG: zinc ribbon domain-containing protein [Treponema sp.]|jgi:RsiW-degrading membrane proteinase PrsW (M82 family)|nr:zinc ribbon domain-containing protein [Treponema sp.]